MADEWWSSARSGGASACSTAPAKDNAAAGWTTSPAATADSTSSITFQDPNRGAQQPLSDAASLLADRHADWTNAFLSGKVDTSLHAMLQDDVSTARPYRAHPAADEAVMNPFRDMAHNSFLDQTQPAPSSYGIATAPLQSLFDTSAPTALHNISAYGSQPPEAGYDNMPMAPFSQLLKSAAPSTTQQHGSSAQLQFSGGYMPSDFLNTPGLFGAPLPSQLLVQALQPRPSCSSNVSTLMVKSNSESVQDACSSATRRSIACSPAVAKKPRIETPSPLPTFKVRKEKLGDRITALQQLVSPFGKTDTASVLHEAIEYIKFLHEQVASLSSLYMKNGSPMQLQHKGSETAKDDGEPKQDLRSRGLCLVPVASTYTVGSETAPEFWHPTFGGTFR